VCVLAGLALGYSLQGVKAQGSAPTPAPTYTPDQVVKIQLDALRNNDQPQPNAGIATTFAFASPRNQAITGPLQRFVGMLHAPGYAFLLNHRSVKFGKLEVTEDVALQPVVLTAADGREIGYLFELSKSESAACSACWMTDSVVPFPVPENADEDGILL
jgi:hypothetical protein